MTELMYYVYSRSNGYLITKTNNLKDLEKYLPELVEVIIAWILIQIGLKNLTKGKRCISICY